MCMEDVRNGRASLSRSQVFTLAAGAQEVLSGSDLRMALILGAPSAGTVTYLDQPGAAVGAGLNLGTGQPPIILNISDHGDLVRHQWWATPDAGGRIVAVAETILPKT